MPLSPDQIQEVMQIVAQMTGSGPSGGGIAHREAQRAAKKVKRPVPMAVGSMAFTGNLGGAATVIPGAGTFVRIGNGAPGHPLFIANPQNMFFNLVGVSTDTQELQYAGPRTVRLCIRGIVSLQEGIIGAVGIAVQLLQNGALIPNTSIDGQTGGLISSAGNLVTEGLVEARPGDTFTMEVANLTNANNLTASGAILTVGAAS